MPKQIQGTEISLPAGNTAPSFLLEMTAHETYNRVVDLARNQAAKPWFHQYLDPVWYHLWRIVSTNV